MSFVDDGQEDEEIEAVVEPEELEEAVSVEDRARAMGWHPQDEYRGDPKRWTDAATFVARGEAEVPILRDQNRRLSEKVVKMDRDLDHMRKTTDEMNQALGEMRSLAKRANEQGYQRALRELKQQQLQAVEQADTVAYEQIEQQIAELTSEREQVAAAAPPAAPTPAPAPSAELDPAVVAFGRDNPWWNQDPFLTRQMVNFHLIVMNERPDLALSDQLDVALDRLERQYPERFAAAEPIPAQPRPQPRPRTPVAAASAPRTTPVSTRTQKDGWDVITDPQERAEAKRAYASIKRYQPDMSEAEYIAIYQDPHADVLTIQRDQRKRRNG